MSSVHTADPLAQKRAFPRTTAWYDALPARKLHAFATCQGHTRLPRLIQRDYPTLAQLDGLPRSWRFALANDPFAEDWVPETLLVLQYLLLRDAFFVDDATFFAATKARILSTFSAPGIRPLMAVMSPHLLILGASTRWSHYHRGTELKVRSKSIHTLEGVLSFPPGLYPPLMLEDTRVAVAASIEMTGKVAQIQATLANPGVCTLQGSWS